MSQTDIMRYAITAVLIAAVMFLRLRNMGKMRKLRIEVLWVIPTIYLAFAGLLFWRMPPEGLGWLWTILAFAVGAAIGWQRGRMVAVTVDPATHELNQRSSPAAILFILLLIGIRLGMRSALTGSGAYWHPGAALVTDIFVASAIGILAIYRLEIYLRARRLLREARGY
jgi:NAD/NADP transhydrogenase beta subunit